MLLAVILVAAAVAGIGVAATHQAGSPSTGQSATQPPAAPAVDGVGCGSMEEQAYHIHQHLALYDHGKQIPLPSGIGIPGSEDTAQCYYWIHVHAADPGVIHVESPITKTFTLGAFFDIWQATRQYAVPPGDAYVRLLKQAAAAGQVTVFYNGKRWNKGYRRVPLTPYALITVEIGKPVVAPRHYQFAPGL